MRILIIHISDFHIQEKIASDGEARFVQMRRTLGDLGEYEAVFILFTGDAAFSGKADEYEHVESLFSKMEHILSEGYKGKITTLAIPGNHDLDAPEDVSVDELNQLQDNPSWSVREQIAQAQIQRMANWNMWASKRDCSLGDSQVVSKTVVIGEEANCRRIQLSLINTVPGSMRMAVTDKQHHYIDERSISCLACEEDNDLHLALAHHSPEWFADEVMRPLSDELRSYVDILLLGHEHVAGSYERVDDDSAIIVLPGGKGDFSPGSTFTFSSINLNMGVYPYEARITIHEWQPEGQCFRDKEKPVREILPKRGAPMPTAGFIKQVHSSAGNALLTASFMDYFVFPPLVGSADLDTYESGRIDNFTDFFELFSHETCICVKGDGNSGKTTFACALYLESMRRGYAPILLSPDDSQPSVRIMLKNLIEKQYGASDNTLTRYNHLDKRRKLLVIDDFDRLNKRKGDSQYLDELLDHIGAIVLISRNEPDFDAAGSVKRQLGFEGTSAVYTMGPFVKSKRDKLVRNVCEIEETNDDIQARLTNVVDHVVSSHQGMFEMSPDFIIHYAKYLLAHPEAMSVNDVVPMGQLYESNIEDTVRRTLAKTGKGARGRFAQTVMVILEEVAYEMHSSKMPAISQEKTSEIVAGYCEEHVLDLDINVFIDTVRQSSLMTVDSAGKLRFCSINQLAFFTAKRIQRSTLQTELGDELEYLLDNICFEINERILLFLAYLRDNNELPYELCDRLNNMLSSESAFDLGSQSLTFLAEPIGSKMKIASREDDERRSRVADENESQLAKRGAFEYSDIYDYDEDEAGNVGLAMIKALKYLQMLGRSYVAQYVHTDRTTKEFIREALFEGPSKILKKTMDRFEENFDRVVDDLFDDLNQMVDDNLGAQSFDRDDVAKFLQTFGCVMCVSIYDTVAYSCAESDTVHFLCEYESDDSSARMLKICMQENALDSKAFIDVICNAGANCKEQGFERTLLQLIANKHIATHPSVNHRDIDRISQHVFGSNAAKKSYIAGRISARTPAQPREEQGE